MQAIDQERQVNDFQQSGMAATHLARSHRGLGDLFTVESICKMIRVTRITSAPRDSVTLGG